MLKIALGEALRLVLAGMIAVCCLRVFMSKALVI